MKKDKEDTMIVTIRMKQKVAELYKVIMVKKGISFTEDITRHISNQVKEYKLVENSLNLKDENFSKINVRVNRDLYTQYKVQMIVNHTTPTADIIRYVLNNIEENKDILNELGILKDI